MPEAIYFVMDRPINKLWVKSEGARGLVDRPFLYTCFSPTTRPEHRKKEKKRKEKKRKEKKRKEKKRKEKKRKEKKRKEKKRKEKKRRRKKKPESIVIHKESITLS